MKSAALPILFECTIHPALADSAPEYFQKLSVKLQDWNIPFLIGNFLSGENNHIFICPESYLMKGQIKKETLVIIPSNPTTVQYDSGKKSQLWLSDKENWDKLESFFYELNVELLRKKNKELKAKMEKSLELFIGIKVQEPKGLPPVEFHLKHKGLEELIIKKLKLKHFSILKEIELYLIAHNTYEYLLPLWENNEYLAFSGKLSEKEASLLIHYLKEAWIEQDNMSTYRGLSEEEYILEEGYKNLSLPMALMTMDGDILLHNPNFVKLSLTPDQCLGMTNEAKMIHHEGEAYKVIKKDVGNKLFFIGFQSVGERKNSQGANAEELGIISSSIAHELNNPLAGIMAAISLLMLDENWSEDALMDLKEMKRGSGRCKALVETFLGFSRMNPQHTTKGSFEQGLEQALNLIRFRLVENNMKLSFKKELSGSQAQINNSIFSMVLYLIFGELITSFSHHLLVAKNEDHAKLIEGKIFVERRSGNETLVIRVQSVFEFEDSLKGSKLIKHLLDLENYRLKITDNQIIIQT